ncbi:hypothetical protein Salat_0830300 [Sesamum alatum]|uniref:Uncharacterized protein n=1 Tax=Sesamum alatum TaxID=300844 RepID=A0AAE1YIG2_9LAMI|nr:hypothetical protein Salat_0830300 [Sesamum alatum]
MRGEKGEISKIDRTGPPRCEENRHRRPWRLKKNAEAWWSEVGAPGRTVARRSFGQNEWVMARNDHHGERNRTVGSSPWFIGTTANGAEKERRSRMLASCRWASVGALDVERGHEWQIQVDRRMTVWWVMCVAGDVPKNVSGARTTAARRLRSRTLVE